MGKEIVRHESPKEPSRRSRLWCYEDIVRVLKDNSGTDAIEGIVLKVPVRVEERLSVKSFSQIRRLRILKIGSRTITKNFSKLSNISSNIVEWDEDRLESMPTKELRLMHWFQFPFKSLPMSFQPNNLVKLNMRGSNIEQLWKGCKSLGSLKYLDLSDSRNLMETPEFSKAQKLEKINFKGCTRLSKVHPSIAVLKQLKKLDFSQCKRLKRLPNTINLESLENLKLSGCSGFEKFPVVENMTSLLFLSLDSTAIKELPSTFVNLSGFRRLSVKDCRNLSILPSAICGLSNLEQLELSECKKIDELPDLSRMERLKVLKANKTGISQFPSLDLRAKNLETLTVDGCKSSDPTGFSLLVAYFSVPVMAEENSNSWPRRLYCWRREALYSLHIEDRQIKLLHLEMGVHYDDCSPDSGSILREVISLDPSLGYLQMWMAVGSGLDMPYLSHTKYQTAQPPKQTLK